MRALMVTKFLPLPDNSGGKQRSLAVARRIARRAELALCAFDDGTADLDGLRALGIEPHAIPWPPSWPAVAAGALRSRSASASRFAVAPLRDLVRRVAAQAPLDLLQVEYLQLAPLCSAIAARRRLLDLHNVESALMASYRNTKSGLSALAPALESAALRAMERRYVGGFDNVAVVSETERDRLGPAPGVLVCPNGYEVHEALPPATGHGVVFVATMGWAPNVDAALWLGQEIWPRVLERCPAASLAIVGRDPAPSVRAMACSSIEVTGTVPDVRDYLARARVAVAPLRAGGGTRLKILEALSAGRPVVATSIGADGLEDLIGRGVIVEDSPGPMADAIAHLLTQPGQADALGHRGRSAVAKDHGWDRALAPMIDLLRPPTR